MARRYAVPISAVAFVAATAKGAFELATPSTVAKVCIVEWILTFDGVTATNVPPLCEWIQTTATGTGSAFTPLQLGGAAVASITTAKTAITTIGSTPTIYFPMYIPPTSGFGLQSPLGREPIEMMASQFWTLRVLAANNVNGSGWVVFEE